MPPINTLFSFLTFSAEDLHSIWLTIWTAALAILIIFAPATVMAWLLARTNWTGKTLVETLIALPLVLPPVATGLILLKLLGRRGPIGSWLYHQFHLDIAFSWKAIIITLGVMSFPLLVKNLRTAFEEVPKRLEQIARTLGKHPIMVFFTITLPLAKRGIIAGIILSFARALGEFGATIMLAGMISGETSTLALSIYQHVNSGDDAHAMRLLSVSIFIAFIALFISETLSKKSVQR